MELLVQVKEKRVFVTCKAAIAQASYSFALNKLLSIQSCSNNGIPVSVHKTEECTLAFRPPMKKHTCIGLQPGTLTIEYEGELSGWYAFMQEELYHFSMYNGWYPVGFDVVEEYEAKVVCGADYELINGEYHPETGLWHYSTRGQSFIDCNIMLINRRMSRRCANQKAAVWYFEEKHDDTVNRLLAAYEEICRYYADLYGSDKTKNSTIVILPLLYPQGGAYQRDRLTVFADIDFPFERLVHILAHEIAHSYACGADCTTWEDWLNETHAEWSALLYELSHNAPLFDVIMKSRQNRGAKAGLLKPNGQSRPDDVHDTGTMLYYELYKKRGAGAIRTLLREFDRIPTKDTEHFLAALHENHPELSEDIRKYI